jgi:hypothetical protein
MSSKKQGLKDNIKKAMNTPVMSERDAGEGADNRQNEPVEKAVRKKAEKPLKIFGSICIAIAIIAFMFTGTPRIDTSESARIALENKVSTAVSAGSVLLAADENVEPKDYTITHQSDAKDTRIWVWDYAAEDGDYVQVLVNGAPISDAFMIKHKPKELTVPASGEVQIKGIRDGGGGITYAVRYEANRTSYFNGAPEGEANTYTLRKE